MEHAQNLHALKDFPYTEFNAMRELGIGSRDEIRSLRRQRLAEHEDFAVIKGRIQLSENGLRKLRNAVGVPETAFAKNTPPAPVAERFTLVLAKITINPFIVMAVFKGDDPNMTKNWVRVRVGQGGSKNLRRGMELPCIKLSDTLFKLDRRTPRFPGRW